MISVRLHSVTIQKRIWRFPKIKKLIPIYDPGRFKIYLLARDTFFQLLIIFNRLGLNLYLKRGLFIHFWVPHSSYSLQGPAVIDQKNIHWRQPLQILPNKIRGSKIDLLKHVSSDSSYSTAKLEIKGFAFVFNNSFERLFKS